jgi:hypothetical protein
MNYEAKPRKLVENMYVHNGTILFIRHGIDVEIGLAMAIVTLVPTPATTRRCWQLWQTRITMLVYIVACYSTRRLVNIMTTEKERHRKEKLRLHRTSKVKLGWPQNSEGGGGGTIVECMARKHECCTHANFPVLLRAVDCLLSTVKFVQDLNLKRFPISTAQTWQEYTKNLVRILVISKAALCWNSENWIINKRDAQNRKRHKLDSWDLY